MFFRILKRDLTDKAALNITLFIFMVIASVCVFIASSLIYIKLGGTESSYKACNTSDIIVATSHDLSDHEAQVKRVTDLLMSYPETDRVYRSETVSCSGLVDFPAADDPDLYFMYAFAVPTERNIPYDLNDKPLRVPDGCVAISQNLRNYTHTDVGGKMTLTTEIGNIYEFTVSDIYKNPAADQMHILYFSDADMAVIKSESPIITDWYEYYAKPLEGDYISALSEVGYDIMNKLSDDPYSFAMAQKTLLVSNDGILGVIISIALIFISIFMIFLIFITIHFSLRSAIKREEKEIGAMKAIGVYSLSYKAIFAAKYLAFAVTGGLIAIPIALPLGKMLVNEFVFHTILPPDAVTVLISAASLAAMVLIIIGFIFISLGRMDKISVMDAIHGENRGERWGKLKGVFLHKSSHMGTAFFLAVQSILIKLKRYMGLILAYTLCICMILIIVRMKDSIVSAEYMKKYWNMGDMDFYMEIDNDYMSKLSQKTGSYDGIMDNITEHLAENGVNVSLTYFRTQMNAVLTCNGKTSMCLLLFGLPDTGELTVSEGGKAPLLYNEVAASHYHAVKNGIKLGDTVSIEYKKYDPENISSETVTEDFIVTGFIENLGMDCPHIVMGQEFSGAMAENIATFSQKLLCPKNEYDYYFNKMTECYPDGEIKFYPKEEVFRRSAGDGIETAFNILIKVTAVITSVVTVLLTVLYQNIFLEEETADIALMKSMGFGEHNIKLWQFLRMFILLLCSIALSMIIIIPADMAVSAIAASILRLVHFDIVVRFLPNFVIIPACAAAIVSLVLLPALAPVRGIQIWRVRNE